MPLTVTLAEFSAFEKILPLASGYLQAYARDDPAIAAGCSFRIYSVPAADTQPAEIVAALAREPADVYAISCYIWNMGLVRQVLPGLRRACPDSYIMLGGPQVMNHAADYVPPDAENVLVCNGEGEHTFREFLRELFSPAPDFSAVPGVTFWRGGELITTERPARIRDLTEIPTPYDSGIFADGQYSSAILETNRGCPFHCAFCYWGAATNDKVNKQEMQRILDDVTWISEHRFVALMIADANWGLAPRDVEVTKHIVACRERNGYPLMVAMAAAKNKPERMAEITEILVQGGLLTSQPISLQTLSPTALEMVERTNIRPETYSKLQQSLREKRISSYIELIWPLPGETLASFREGIAELCRSRADTIIAYPHLLLHNTPMYDRQQALGLRTERVPDPVAEADIVVSTAWVSRREYELGVWFAYAVHSLYNLRGLYYLANYLDRAGTASFAEFFEAAAAFFREHPGNPVCDFFTGSIASMANYSMFNNGEVAHVTLHAHREAFAELLAEFSRSQSWWRDPLARAAFELDLAALPYIYHERARWTSYPYTEVQVTASGGNTAVITLPPRTASLLADLDMPHLRQPPPARLRLRHSGGHKMPYMPQQSLGHNLGYCQGMILRLREFLPVWAVDDPGAAPTDGRAGRPGSGLW